jgi:hypothetical protein
MLLVNYKLERFWIGYGALDRDMDDEMGSRTTHLAMTTKDSKSDAALCLL